MILHDTEIGFHYSIHFLSGICECKTPSCSFKDLICHYCFRPLYALHLNILFGKI